MAIIYTDIVKHWSACWKEAIIAGILFMIIGGWMNHTMNHTWKQPKKVLVLFLADGIFFYYLLYVTLLSRVIGSRREVELLPFISFDLLSSDFHYVVENVLFFIPFGFLLYMTLHAFGRKCNVKIILLAAFLTSLSVEMLQYIFSCGKSETDDVITNVSGAVIGYMLTKLKRNRNVE